MKKLLRSELEVQLDRAQKESVQMDERIKFLRAEKSDQFQMADDIQMELGKIQLFCYTLGT